MAGSWPPPVAWLAIVITECVACYLSIIVRVEVRILLQVACHHAHLNGCEIRVQSTEHAF